MCTKKLIHFFYAGLILLVSLLLSSCISASGRALQALNEASYRQAIQYALEALAENPGDPEAAEILTQSWSRANSEWRGAAEAALTQEDPDSKAVALTYFDALIEIHTMVVNAGWNQLNANPQELQKEADTIRTGIARAYLDAGSALYYKNTVEDARKAVDFITKAFELDPSLSEEFSYLFDLAVEKGTFRVFVFTGPDTNPALNGIEIIPRIEDQLDKMSWVEAVRVPARYAAPVNDDHNAKDFARGHGAELMLHIEPATTWSSSLTSTSRPLGIDSWEIEDTSLQSEGSSTLRLVLIDLSDDTVLSDTSIEVSAFLSSDTVLHAVAPTGNTAVQGPGMNAPQNLSVHTVPAGTDRYTLARSLSNAGVTLPQWGFETGAEPLLNSPEDLRLFTSREDLDDFSRIGEHTFFLFDAIVYDAYGDGNHTYDYTYGQYLAEGFEGRLATSAMERQTYNAMRNILSSPEAKTELEERFMELFYKTYIGDRVAEAVAPLLF